MLFLLCWLSISNKYPDYLIFFSLQHRVTSPTTVSNLLKSIACNSSINIPVKSILTVVCTLLYVPPNSCVAWYQTELSTRYTLFPSSVRLPALDLVICNQSQETNVSACMQRHFKSTLMQRWKGWSTQGFLSRAKLGGTEDSCHLCKRAVAYLWLSLLVVHLHKVWQ